MYNTGIGIAYPQGAERIVPCTKCCPSSLPLSDLAVVVGTSVPLIPIRALTNTGNMTSSDPSNLRTMESHLEYLDAALFLFRNPFRFLRMGRNVGVKSHSDGLGPTCRPDVTSSASITITERPAALFQEQLKSFFINPCRWKRPDNGFRTIWHSNVVDQDDEL